jgi:SnoaL-like protein
MKKTMNRTAAEEFAVEWIRLWNGRDLEGVLSHYAADVAFRSPKAAALLGKDEVNGKVALRAYWEEGLRRNPTLHFELDHFMWDERARILTVVYWSGQRPHRTRACEEMQLGADGLVARGEAFYGATT